jgi:flagellar biosynthetic protein FlhB
MSGDTDLNKSEQATPYKLEQARKKGIIAKSQELGMVVSLACAGGYIYVRGDVLFARLGALSERALSESAAIDGGGQALMQWMQRLVVETVDVIAPLIGVVLLGALLATLAQTGVLFAPAAMKPDFSKINPMQGLKRVFSLQTLIEAAKACFKMAVYSGICLLLIYQVARSLTHAGRGASGIALSLSSLGMKLLMFFLLAAAVFAAIDQILVRRMFARRMRMSKHEQKQEIKQREGDPRIKQRRKQLQRELLQRAQSMRNVRGADVLVTNPTHYAIALKYEPKKMLAPTIVAKGSGEFALRLRKLAFVYGVPVIESRLLARQLFHKVPIEREVPETLYRDIAAIYLRLRSRGAEAAA